MIQDGIIIFFYVDSIILAYARAKEQKAQQAIKQLQEQYTITGGYDLYWFLGMEITSNRSNQKVHLSKSAYTTKTSQLADKRSLQHDTPMAVAEFQLYNGAASMSAI
jgi:hypothetical protein